jgi:hypothetical protein
VNTASLTADTNLALQKIASLMGYQNFLSQARQWKGTNKIVDSRFERQVQTEAAQAVSDGNDVAGAVLRLALQRKSAGVLDGTLQAFVAGLTASGPVQISDLWNDVAGDPAARQIISQQGVPDQLYSALDSGMRQFSGQIAAAGAGIAANLTFTEQGQTTGKSYRFVVNPSASGPATSLDDLLKRGQFERAVTRYQQTGALSLEAGVGANQQFEPADAILAGTGLGLAFLAQHARKLEDTGLDTQTGAGAVLGVIFLVALLTTLVGGILETQCSGSPQGSACQIGKILSVLGILVMAITTLIADPGSGLVLALVVYLPLLLSALGVHSGGGGGGGGDAGGGDGGNGGGGGERATAGV